jgi:hypothetical protein
MHRQRVLLLERQLLVQLQGMERVSFSLKGWNVRVRWSVIGCLVLSP